MSAVKFPQKKVGRISVESVLEFYKWSSAKGTWMCRLAVYE